MKKYFLSLIAASVMFCVPLISYAATPREINQQYNSIRTEIRKENYADAVQQADEILADKELSTKDKVRFWTLAGQASAFRGTTQYSVAKSYFEKIIGSAAVDNTTKIKAINDLANAYITSLTGQYLDKMDITPAHTILNRALQLSNLQPEETAVALRNIGKLYDRQDKDKEALKTYRQILNIAVSNATKKEVWEAMVDVYVKQALFGTDQQRSKAIGRAEKIVKRQDFNLVSLYRRVGDFDTVKTLLLKTLDDPKATGAQRWAAFQGLPCFTKSTGRGPVTPRSSPIVFRSIVAQIKQLSTKYLPELLKQDPNRAAILWNTFDETPVFWNTFYGRTTTNPSYIAWAAPMLMKVQQSKLDGNERRALENYTQIRTKYINALAALHQNKRAATQAISIQQDEKLSGTIHLWGHLVDVALTSSTADTIKAAQAKSTLSDTQRVTAIIDAVQTTIAAGKYDTARSLYHVYESLLPHLPTAKITCVYMENAPSDVSAWMDSPLLKDGDSSAKLDRPYGDNFKQLVTDVNARRTGSTAKDRDTSTTIHIVCDAQGIHLFYNVHDPRAQEVENGLLRGSSFESYLAPGENEPYYWFMPRLPNSPVTTGSSDFITMYPNANWRLPSTEDGTFRNDIRRTKDGFGISVFFSWKTFYDKLPVNGTVWKLGAIDWSRSGGYSFGGSQSVHNPTGWGNIVFNGLSEEDVNAIKRNIIFSAVKNYTASKKINAPIGRWNDAELGDPAFYQSHVAPLLARLDRYAEMVNKDLTAAQVKVLFKEAVPGWMEIEYKVAALRTRYLKEHFLAK